MIELDEGNEQNNDINEIKESQNNILKNEINYLRKLIKETDAKLSKENQNNNIINIENLDEILDLKNKKKFEIQPNSLNSKDISGKNDVKKVDSTIIKKWELEENANFPTNSNKLCIDSNKIEDLLRFKKENENMAFKEEYNDLLPPENFINDINLEILNNNDIRKDSFISYLSNIEYLNNLIDNEQFIE